MDSETAISNTDALHEQMCQLWQAAFCDDREFILSYFSHYDSPATRITRHDKNGNIIAMMHYHQFVDCGIVGAYIYGVATDTAWRGQGIARQMLEESFDRMQCDGIQVAMLIAEEESLRSWYATMGFTLLNGTAVALTGYDGMDFALDDATMNVPMIKAIGDCHINSYRPSHNITILKP